jgi:hypothetical protein
MNPRLCGAMIISNVIDIDNAALRADLVVQVVWDDVADDLTLPRFRPLPVMN